MTGFTVLTISALFMIIGTIRKEETPAEWQRIKAISVKEKNQEILKEEGTLFKPKP